jgi:hypothetical protein
MAVKSANGFIPEIWDASILRTYEANLVANKITWDKSSAVLKYGDTIHFNGLSDPTVTGSYTGTLSYETLVDSRVSMLIDQQNTYAFMVDDLEEAMSNVDLKGSQAQRAAYQLQKTCDAYVLGATTAGKAGTTVTDASLDTATVLSVFSQVARKLDEQNVPMGEKWIVISPWVREKLILAGVVHNINEGMDGNKGGVKWANYNDLDIYVSTNLVNATSEVSATTCLAGSYRAIGFAQSILKSEMLKDIGAFGNYARGLMVYGTEVIFPNELINLQLTYAAETAI